MRLLAVFLLPAALSGCAVIEFVMRERGSRDVEIVDKEVRTVETRAFLTLPSPDSPDLQVKVIERVIQQMKKVRRYTRIERVRRADVRLNAAGHIILWTIGWIAGGPLVWYPILNGWAKGSWRRGSSAHRAS